MNIKEIDTKTAKIAYRQYGNENGYPVVCLPPWMTTSIIYKPLHNVIGPKYKLVCPDIPGWGLRSTFHKQSVEIDSFIDAMYEFINKLNLSEYSLLGYSYGGIISQGLVSQKNLQPSKLILVSTLNAGFSIFSQLHYKIILDSTHKALPWLKNKDLMKKAYLYFMGLHISFNYHEKRHTDFFDEILEDIGDISLENGLASILSLTKRGFLSTRLKEIDTLLILGQKDHTYVKNGMKDISEYLKIKPIVISNVNHHHLVFKPEETAKQVVKFIHG